MSVLMVCPRDYTLRTTLGHTIAFKADEPTPVPDSAYQEALSKNILPAKVPRGEGAAFEMAHAEITGTLRDALVFDAIETLVKRNNVEDFGGGGPKAAALARETGIQLSSREAANYYTRYKQIKAENSELPSHPNVELVRELQGLTTRKQLEAFATDIGVAIPPTKGKALSEVKSSLLYAIVNQNQAPLTSAESKPEKGAYVKPNSLEMD
jgi:hypothetical protein